MYNALYYFYLISRILVHYDLSLFKHLAILSVVGQTHQLFLQ